MSNVLDPSALVSKLPALLPAENKELQSAQDGLAALAHTAMNALGFRLIGVDDSSVTRTFEGNALPTEWNSHGPGSYTLRYKHEQSSFEFVVKLAKLGKRTVLNAIALEVSAFTALSSVSIAYASLQTDKAASLDVATDDFTSPSFFPHSLAVADAQPLVHGFISSNRVADFISQFQIMIIQKLVPALRKEGYIEQETETVHPTFEPGPSNARAQTIYPPNAPERNSPLQILPRNPLEIGRTDREPFPRNPFAPPSLFPGSEGDGMFVGPNHPIFGAGPGGPGGLRGSGPWGGDGFLPPIGAPPGARFDPVGPGLGPFPGGSLPPFGGGPGRGHGNMRDPDPDEFMPPGAVSATTLLH